MPTLLVTTCGTSVLTNGVDKNMADLLRRTANSAASEIEPAELAVIEKHAAERSRKLAGADVREVRLMSAEMNGVFGFYGGRLPDKSARGADLHYLLSTDTFQGRRAAGVIRGCMEHLGLNAQLKVLDGLSAKNVEAFHTGMNSALEWFDEVVRDYGADKAWRVVLNLTGGFKAQQGILQMLGMLYADEVGYIFETNSEYIRIPYMPVRLDLDEAVGGHLKTFRRMALLPNVADEEAAGIPEILFTREKNGCTLSFWGGVVWQRMKSDLYGREPLYEFDAWADGDALRSSTGGKQPLDGGLDLGRVDVPDDLVPDLPARYEKQHRDALDAVTRGDRRVVVYVDRVERHPAFILPRHLLQVGFERHARPAPRRPEVHHRRQRAIQDHFFELCVHEFSDVSRHDSSDNKCGCHDKPSIGGCQTNGRWNGTGRLWYFGGGTGTRWAAEGKQAS
ncbi:MAG: putative CRISPR-associated protein [Deltaproteobacteria bacterium]|nr:putative CRISPR-associated protein [Deltaproteobacteria bacterium]